ncbi:MAG: ATP-binding protein, partial [Planctomycetota bacterium]
DDISERLDDSLAALLFAAARELLLNAVKHAQAPTATVRLEPAAARGPAGRSGVQLIVADEGVGFDAAAADDAADARTGFGMSDLRHHVDLLGGSVDVASEPGAGCVVEVRVPLRDGRRSPAGRQAVEEQASDQSTTAPHALRRTAHDEP